MWVPAPRSVRNLHIDPLNLEKVALDVQRFLETNTSLGYLEVYRVMSLTLNGDQVDNHHHAPRRPEKHHQEGRRREQNYQRHRLGHRGLFSSF